MASLGARRNELNGVVHNAQPGINFHLREMERDREGERKARKKHECCRNMATLEKEKQQQQQIYIVIQIYGLTRESPRSAQTERRSSLKCACVYVCVMECYGEGWGVRAKKDGKAGSVARIFKRRKAKKELKKKLNCRVANKKTKQY